MTKYSRDQLLEILEKEFLSTSEAIEVLGITKSAFMSLVKRNKLEQINKGGAKLYLKRDVQQRLEEQEELRKKFRPYDEE
jgi:predicted XRE-type DNA-binding protein